MNGDRRWSERGQAAALAWARGNTEAEPSLPGCERVRDAEVATPQLDAPFALTSAVARTPRGQQGGLFDGDDA